MSEFQKLNQLGGKSDLPASPDVAVLETARGGILRSGLGFDRSNIGAVLNVSDDHLGLGGINTVDELWVVNAQVNAAISSGGTFSLGIGFGGTIDICPKFMS